VKQITTYPNTDSLALPTPPLVHGTLDISPQPASWTFASNSKEIVRIYPDGRVVKNPELSWDEAALAFWEAVERTRAPQPSVPSGEAVAWGLADANGYLRGAKLYRGNLPEAKRDLESALNIELHEVPLYAAPPQERVSEAVREVLSRCEDFRRNPSASGTANATFEHIAQILTAALAHGQTMSNEIREYDTNGNVIHSRDSSGYEWWREYDDNGNEIHSRDSIGFEVWREYDTNGKLINTRTNND
jgi:YD repeat-containing protein